MLIFSCTKLKGLGFHEVSFFIWALSWSTMLQVHNFKLLICLLVGIQIMLWGSLPNSKEDTELSDDDMWMEECCR